MTRSVLGLASVFAIATVLGLRAQEPQGQHGAKSESASHAQHISGDSDYVEMLLMHHKHGIEMSQAVIDRGQSEEVKQLARNILEGQQRDSKELEQLRDKLESSASAPKGTSGRSGHGAGMGRDSSSMKEMQKKMDANVEQLRAASGAEADRMFLSMMTRHHQQAITMTNAAMPKLSAPAVRQFAEKTVDTQKKEIAELKAVK